MIDNVVLASINLHAVLRNIEDLSMLDPAVRGILAADDLSIRFAVPGLDKLVLGFAKGICTAKRGDTIPYTMNLHFSGPDHFNQMIAGTKNPLPTKGFRHIGFLKEAFTKTAEILTAYLRPDPARLRTDAEFRRISTILTAYTAFYALSEVANLDRLGRMNAARIEDGDINVEIAGGCSIYVRKQDGRLSTHKGQSDLARAFMHFDSVDTACGILTGQLDSFACIGQGRLSFRGRIPMIENLNRLLSQVQQYLA